MGNDGRQVYNIKYYNLDMIISVEFRVNSYEREDVLSKSY